MLRILQQRDSGLGGALFAAGRLLIGSNAEHCSKQFGRRMYGGLSRAFAAGAIVSLSPLVIRVDSFCMICNTIVYLDGDSNGW